jgi:hypothetical protein
MPAPSLKSDFSLFGSIASSHFAAKKGFGAALAPHRYIGPESGD